MSASVVGTACPLVVHTPRALRVLPREAHRAAGRQAKHSQWDGDSGRAVQGDPVWVCVFGRMWLMVVQL